MTEAEELEYLTLKKRRASAKGVEQPPMSPEQVRAVATDARDADNSPMEGLGEDLVKAGKSALDGFTMGALPYAVAGVDSLVNDSKFDESLAEQKKGYNQAVSEQPAASLGGALLTPMLGVGALKGAAKAGAMGLTAGGASALSAGLHSEKPLQKALTEDALPAGAVGLGGGWALGGASAGAAKLLPWLKQQAASRALKAAGADSSDVGRLMRKDMVGDVGQTLLDRKVVTPLSSPSNVYERVQKYLATDGADVGKFADELNASGHKFDMSPTANRLSSEIVDPLMKGGLDDQKLGGRAFKELTDLNNRSPQGFADWLQYKRGMAKHVKHDSLKDAPYREALDQISGGVGGEIQAQAQKVNPVAAAGLKDANKRFGMMAEAEKIAEKGLKKDLSAGLLGSTAVQAAKNAAATGANRSAKVAGGLSEADAKLLARWLASQQGKKE